ncbi:MAG: hypothetical protein JKY45_10430 [Emcibacter sp.]|nr:hypothetical protein [Emcibacter sp.]
MKILLSILELGLFKGQRTRIFTYVGLGLSGLAVLSGDLPILLGVLVACGFVVNAAGAEHEA